MSTKTIGNEPIQVECSDTKFLGYFGEDAIITTNELHFSVDGSRYYYVIECTTSSTQHLYHNTLLQVF